jgi:imidazolonepropionase-like amidohydrolase
VTSVPAAAIDLDYRIGYVRPGYDADIVVWDANPLSIGATPLQVFIDGLAQLKPLKTKESMGMTFTDPVSEAATREPKMRVRVEEKAKEDFCDKARKPKQKILVTGIKKTFLDNYPELAVSLQGTEGQNLTLVVDDGSVRCLGNSKACADAVAAVQDEDLVTLDLADGYILPGLTAMTSSLGMLEISTDPDTGDGFVDPLLDATDPSRISYAKYGVSLKGKAFARARMGGVTRAISPLAYMAGFMGGISAGILTSQEKTLLNGGVFQGDVALHVHLDSEAKVGGATMSSVVGTLRSVIESGKGKHNDTVYGKVATGKLPLVVMANNQV